MKKKIIIAVLLCIPFISILLVVLFRGIVGPFLLFRVLTSALN